MTGTLINREDISAIEADVVQDATADTGID